MNASLESLKTLCVHSARRALQWRLPVLYAAVLLLPVVIMVAPAWVVLDTQLSYSVHAAALAQQLDLASLTDLLEVGKQHALGAQLALWVALACTALSSPLLAGATVTAARSTEPLPLGALLAGGMAEYGRMARMLLWSAIVMGAALWLGASLRELAHPDEALLPADGQWAGYAAKAATLLLAWAALVTVDAGRAVLAADRRRKSAVKAWWQGMALLRRQPVAALGSYAVLGAVGFGVAGLLGLARLHFPTGTLPGDVAACVLTQVIAVLLAWFRAARLFALVTVARQ
ncbi:hypothetical protein GCM10027277_47290 [Pseudoduganella ginsengisoli]|uniref:Uncharacterized protein n=1 Tax=Pseudoduganella ginsengisoli TaxID=1462440 RepID=A0A6L6Q2H7_9BURK|nr:hypothetical protein [Pseudoduganella ginsengisoli]MTW04083.1 hypothetical protein [Pseudoduganella ginsengisoli]